MEETTLQKIINTYKEYFRVYCKKCLKIQTKLGQEIPLELNRAQEIVWLMVKGQLDAQKPVRIIILKARQLGISTLIQAILFWFVSLNKNRNALVVAHDIPSSQILFSKQMFFYKKLPAYIKPLRKYGNIKELYFSNPNDDSPIAGLESRVLVKTADDSELGTSFTIHGAHLSEIAIWEQQGLDIEKRLVNLHAAIPFLPYTFEFLETTARGDGRFKELWDDKNSGYLKIFISWVADDEYRLPLEDIFEKDFFELNTKESDPYGDEETEYLYIKDQVKIWYPELVTEEEIENEIYARLNWRRYAIKDLCLKNLNLFKQEYPTTANQAFASGGSNVFNQDVLELHHKFANQNYYEFYYNEGIEKEIKQVNKRNKKAFDLLLKKAFLSTGRSQKAIKEKPTFDIVMFEPPRPKVQYVIGADTAEGFKNGDNCAFVVLKLPNLEEVATFNRIIDPEIFGYILYCIGHLYNNALLGVEANDRGSVTTLRVLTQDMRYPNLYAHERFDVEKHINENQVYGWKTTKSTKPMMVSHLNNAIVNREIKFNNYWTIKQLMKFKKFDNGDLGIAKPDHDDLCIAPMIAYQMAITIPEPIQNNKIQYPVGSLGYYEQMMNRRGNVLW